MEESIATVHQTQLELTYNLFHHQMRMKLLQFWFWLVLFHDQSQLENDIKVIIVPILLVLQL